MLKLSLAVALTAIVAAAVTPSLTARAQASRSRFEYLRVTPYWIDAPTLSTSLPTSSGATAGWGYRACIAGGTEWTCREFPRTRDTKDDALPLTLAALGNEGWELVSVVDERPPDGTAWLTYLFKRARP